MIGWYVHHHGHGHRTRFLAVRPHVRDDVVVFSSLPAVDPLPERTQWVRLERDDEPTAAGGDPALADPTVGGLLHWAPIGHAGHARRLAALAATMPGLDAVVVDVSVEVTVLARLLGRRVVLMTQPGDRTDAAHALGRGMADAVIAPWPAPSVGHDAGVDHVGGISRFEGRRRANAPEATHVLALGGGEHDDAWTAMLERAIAATPDRRWTIAGPGRWLEDPWDALTRAEVVVTAAGQNAIADVAAAGARAVVVPRPRPFDEQRRTAERLDAEGLAVLAEAATDAWPELLARAGSSSPDWSSWGVEGAARRAAAVIERTAGIVA